MASSTHQRRIARAGRIGMVLLGLAGVGTLGAMTLSGRDQPTLPEGLAVAPVKKISMQSTVTTSGEVESSEKTLIECELENMRYRNNGITISTSGSSAIIELVPEGDMVEKGQVICRLDASEYEEMVRQQSIELMEDRALLETARLNLEGLEIQLREYRDGLYVEAQQNLRGAITLAEADVSRQRDRLAWSERMYEIGYMPQSRLTSEQQLMLQTELTLSQAELAYNNLMKYTAPKTILTLEGQIDGARAQLAYHETRVMREEEQLKSYQKQVELCTIRAPHDGFLIYANEDNDYRIELGASVRFGQNLFYLPDLGHMEVHATLHETVVNRVERGMPALVRIEALPHVQLEGEVISVAPLPISIRSRYQNNEVKNFLGRVRLHVVPEGLMPGMTSQVEILTSHNPETLVIPPEALAVEHGRDICYVATADGLDRRPVTIGEYHHDRIEILEGLDEGERVVMEPHQVDLASLVVSGHLDAEEIEDPFDIYDDLIPPPPAVESLAPTTTAESELVVDPDSASYASADSTQPTL